VHISVRAESKHGKRLNPRKADLQPLARDLRREAPRLGHRRRGEPASQSRGSTGTIRACGVRRLPRRAGSAVPARSAKTGSNASRSRKDAAVAWANLFAALRASDSATDRTTAAAIERWVRERSVTRDMGNKSVERGPDPRRDIEPTR
jgi:hypothetical protein